MDRETESLVAALVALFEARTGVDLGRDETAMKRVREAAEKARNEWLTTKTPFEVNLPFLAATGAGPRHLEERFAGADAERVFAGVPLAERLEEARAARARDETGQAARQAESEEKEEDRAAYDRQTRRIAMIGILVVFGAAISITLWLAGREHHEAAPPAAPNEHVR